MPRYQYRAKIANTIKVNGTIFYKDKGDILETDIEKQSKLGKKDPLKHYEFVKVIPGPPVMPTAAVESTPGEPKVDENINPAVLEGRIQGAISKLDKNNDAHWTTSGIPAMKAFNELLGHEITREALNEACPGFNRASL